MPNLTKANCQDIQQSIIDGDLVWVLIDGAFSFHSVIFDSQRYYDKGIKWFSEKEKIQEYVLMNKPLLSLNDLLSVWSYGKVDVSAKESPMFNNFQKLAESKLNNK